MFSRHGANFQRSTNTYCAQDYLEPIRSLPTRSLVLVLNFDMSLWLEDADGYMEHPETPGYVQLGQGPTPGLVDFHVVQSLLSP